MNLWVCPWWSAREILFLDIQPHTSRISCSSDNCRWRVSDSSTSLRWSSSSRWAKRPRISASSLRAASVCWLSAFSWAWELSFSLAAWREWAQEQGERGCVRGIEGKWKMTNEEEEEDGVQRGALTIMMRARERVTEGERRSETYAVPALALIGKRSHSAPW